MHTALVVDDSALARLTLKRYLEKNDIEVFEAECVADCRYWLKHNQAPDVVFMDISMPVEDGFDGLADIRANKETRDLPVIMYSGDATDDAKQKAREGRATGFLRKPVNEEHLKTLLTRLSRRTRRQESNEVEAEPAAVVPAVAPVVPPAIDEQQVHELRQNIGRLNIALERQQEELQTAKSLMQRQTNDIVHLQTSLNEQNGRMRMIAIMGIIATIAALIALFVAFMR